MFYEIWQRSLADAPRGVFYLDEAQYMAGGQHDFQQVLINPDSDKTTATDLEREVLIEHTRPAPGIATSTRQMTRTTHRQATHVTEVPRHQLRPNSRY